MMAPDRIEGFLARFLALVAILIVACRPGTDLAARRALSRLETEVIAARDGQVVDLDHIVSFDWDSLRIYDAYTGYDLIEEAEGIRLGLVFEAYVPEFTCYWVFRRGDERLVGFYDLDGFSLGLCEPPSSVWGPGDVKLRVRDWESNENRGRTVNWPGEG